MKTDSVGFTANRGVYIWEGFYCFLLFCPWCQDGGILVFLFHSCLSGPLDLTRVFAEGVRGVVRWIHALERRVGRGVREGFSGIF